LAAACFRLHRFRAPLCGSSSWLCSWYLAPLLWQNPSLTILRLELLVQIHNHHSKQPDCFSSHYRILVTTRQPCSKRRLRDSFPGGNHCNQLLWRWVFRRVRVLAQQCQGADHDWPCHIHSGLCSRWSWPQ